MDHQIPFLGDSHVACDSKPNKIHKGFISDPSAFVFSIFNRTLLCTFENDINGIICEPNKALLNKDFKRIQH
jgi:hypothetical protein